MNYAKRRADLRKAVGRGPILLHGSNLVPRNYPDNTYPFRQNSHFLYYTGLAVPGLALVMDGDRETLFAPRATMDDIVWTGPVDSPEALARRAGIRRVGTDLSSAIPRSGRIKALPASEALIEAIVRQRSIKAPDEIREIESAVALSKRMHLLAMSMAKPGVRESDIAGAIEGLALREDRPQAYHPIVTVRGEILHNHTYGNRLKRGQLLLVDAGAESALGYASDITRVIPVGGRFSSKQKEIYEIVLRTQQAAIDAIRPGVTYREVHLHACAVMAAGLADAGLMKGDPAEAVVAGAHALFFPHGLGHMLGLDVHDMEDLGDIVGYGPGESRSKQFGLGFLRLAKRLEAGFVLTVEPGIYFIPALIDQWRAAGKHRDFINYAKLASYRDFGGIRMEDDVLVTPKGARVLGPAIPKTIRDVEACA